MSQSSQRTAELVTFMCGEYDACAHQRRVIKQLLDAPLGLRHRPVNILEEPATGIDHGVMLHPAGADEVSFDPGTVIFEENSLGGSMMLLVDGSAAVKRSGRTIANPDRTQKATRPTPAEMAAACDVARDHDIGAPQPTLGGRGVRS